MSRLADVLRARAGEKRKALVIYLTAGDPDDETSRRLVLAAAEAGADIIEVGVPWSDPSADGPAIQAAMHRALASGGGMSKALALRAPLRAGAPRRGMVLFGYANPIFVHGPPRRSPRRRATRAPTPCCASTSRPTKTPS